MDQSHQRRSSIPGLPPAQGLYLPEFEHDSCGVGFICHIKGKSSNKLVLQALEMLENMNHRGACGCEADSGDGAGILVSHCPTSSSAREAQEAGLQAPQGRRVRRGDVLPAQGPGRAAGMRADPREHRPQLRHDRARLARCADQRQLRRPDAQDDRAEDPPVLHRHGRDVLQPPRLQPPAVSRPPARRKPDRVRRRLRRPPRTSSTSTCSRPTASSTRGC